MSCPAALRDKAIGIGAAWYELVRELFEQLPRNVLASQAKETDGELQVLLIGHPHGSDEALWRATGLGRHTCAPSVANRARSSPAEDG